MFLRHEGFLGALGAFMSYEKHGLDDLMVHHLVERFPMGAPYTGGRIHGPPLGDLNEKASALLDLKRNLDRVVNCMGIRDEDPLLMTRDKAMMGIAFPFPFPFPKTLYLFIRI